MFTKLTPRQVVDSLWHRGQLPVDPKIIARRAGIEMAHLSPEDCSRGVIGSYIQDSPPTILYNPMKNKQRVRFAIAHELGHHFLSHGTRPRDTIKAFTLYNNDFIESSANRFAVELLMPKDYVEALYLVGGIRTVEELAARFFVSRLAMKTRLQDLGYLPQ